MERINYRITLDTQKTGVQGMLQGFQTGDRLSRRISINLAAGGDTIEIPVDATACIYVTAPNATETGIHACKIEGNTIIYDVLPITEAGIAMMQVKVFESSVDGAEAILFAPSFAVEVSASSTGDEGAESTVQFTALEQAIAKASAVYNARVQSIEVDADCTFRVVYADGTEYESSALNEAIYNQNLDVLEKTAGEMVQKFIAEKSEEINKSLEAKLDKDLSVLPNMDGVADEDLVYICHNGEATKMTWGEVKEAVVGNADISAIGDGTVKGAIKGINDAQTIKELTYAEYMAIPEETRNTDGVMYIITDTDAFDAYNITYKDGESVGCTLDKLITVKTQSISLSVSTNSDFDIHQEVNAVNGYTPVGVVGHSSGSSPYNTWLAFATCRLTDGGKIHINGHNHGDGAFSGSVTVYVMYIKTLLTSAKDN